MSGKSPAAWVKGIHHIGVAVRDLEASLARWSNLLGAEPSPIEEIPERGVRLAHLRFSKGPEVELLAPLGVDSPVAKFLERRGEGPQHLTLEVANIAAAMRGLKSAGVEFTTAKPLSGARGSLIAFVHPRSFSGVLLELRQERKTRRAK
ncbi:MAG: VOC family protein [Acidobacteriota bacterium]